MPHLMSQLFRSSSKQSRRPLSRLRPRRYALGLERLEDRCVPAFLLRYSTDGGATFSPAVQDNMAGDSNPAAGIIAVNIGALTLNATVSGGTSTPVSVVSLQIQGTAAAGTYDLVVQASLDGLQTAPPPQTLINSFSDATLPHITETARTWIDNNNNDFGISGGANTNIVLDTQDLPPTGPSTYQFNASVPYSITTQIHTQFTSVAGSETTLSVLDNNRITPSSMASPAITTSQQPASASVGSSIADQATVTGLVSPQSGDTVTFNLYSSATTQNSSTLLFTDTEPLSISGSTGTATSAGYTATATGPDYWVATFNGDSTNSPVTSGATAEPVNIDTINTSQTPAIAFVGQPISDTATVTGLVSPSSSDTVTFNLYSSATTQNSSTLLHTDTETVTINGSTATATSSGYTPTGVGSEFWVATFNGDTNNAKVTSGSAAEQVNVDTINTSQTPAIAFVGEAISDTATVIGLVSPKSTDTVTFNLYSSATTQNSSTLLHTDTETITISGSTATVTSSGYTPTGVGAEYWVATFNGDTNNAAVTSGATAETVNVDTINTSQQPASATVGSSIADTATVTGLVGPSSGDTVTFNLYSSATTQNSSTLLFSNTETVSISGSTATATSAGYPTTATGTDYWVATFNGDTNNAVVSSSPTAEPVTVNSPGTPLAHGATATMGYWHNKNGQALIKSFNGSANSTALGNWMASNFPNLFGSFAGQTNTQVAADFLTAFGNVGGVQGNTYAQTFAVALAVYATDPSLGGGSASTGQGFTVKPGGTGSDTFNVGSNGAAFGVAKNTSLTVLQVLQILNSNFNPTTHLFYNGSQDLTSAANNVTNGINQGGDVNASALTEAGLAYSPAQILTGYGISKLSLDGTGQTIAIVDAYDNPAILQSLDTFDSQFGLTSGGPTLYQQYGAAASFLTVLNQDGQTTSLPGTDPNGVGASNWEVEEALDVEWAHAMAPGAHIVVVEANSQSLSDLMSAVVTASSLPNVSVVSMSWGFQEGVSALAQDEAQYDSVLTTPAGHQGVTFVASTGDYGTSDPEYPAFSPNVVAVGGTSLYLNSDNSYSSETAWGYYDSNVGAAIGGGGGISQNESEPTYQLGVQTTGYRTTPDVSFVADPATGAWVADTYNLSSDNPFEVVGGTSLSAPSWAGLFALANQGRAAAGEATLGSAADPTATQEAVYSLPASDYNSVTSGSNGYSASAGYNLVTGLGSPQANLLIPDLVAYSGPIDFAANSANATITQNVSPSNDWALASGGTANVVNAFDALVVSSPLGATGFAFRGATAAATPASTSATGLSPIAASSDAIGAIPAHGSGNEFGTPSSGSALSRGLNTDFASLDLRSPSVSSLPANRLVDAATTGILSSPAAVYSSTGAFAVTQSSTSASRV